MTRQLRQEAGGVMPKVLLDSVASIVEANAAKQSLADVREYLDPVLRAARLQQRNPTASSQRLAKSHSTFVVNLLRVSLAKITSEQSSALQTVYIELASLGLEGLSVLRSSLKGRPHEVEVQRYMLIRKLVSLACHQQALQQSCLLYNALCCQCWQTGRTAAIVMTHSVTYRTQPLPRPDDSNTEISNLVVGSVLNMLLSVVEQSGIQRNLNKVMIVVHDYKCIAEWLSILPEADKAKHSDTLFRYLFKAANQALSLKQQAFEDDCIEICKCAVQACLQSSSHLRLPQVVDKYIQQLPSSGRAELVAHALELVNTSGAVQGATMAINIVQACMSAVSCHPESLKACLALLSSHQQRHDEDRWLAILSVPATALLLKTSDGDGSNSYAWAENLMKANAAIKELLQQLQSRRSGKKPARSATVADGKAETNSNEVANLCQLAHIVLSAISSLRKNVQGSAMQAPYSGHKADENSAAEEEPRGSLCTCLMLAAPLASAAVSLQSQLLPAENAGQCNATDRLSYPALSALITACQIKTAVAIQDSAQTDEVCSADAFESFWSSAAAWAHQQVPPLPLKAAEERWASSALFSCAVQLHNNNLPQSAETLFAAACDAAASSLCKVMHDGSQAAQPEMQPQMQSLVRKNQALANALHQQGRTPAALNTLGNALTLLASLGMASIKFGQPLVLALVTLRAGLQSGPVVKATSKPGSRGHRQRKMMHNMQADAAAALPADATVAAYLDQLPQLVSSPVLGEVLAMEAKAVHEVMLEGLLLHSSAVQQGQSLFKQLGKVWSAQEQPVLHAKALLLQARLSGLLATPETAQDLVQQVTELLADQQDHGASDVLATAHAMRALLHAQQLRQAGAERETPQSCTSSGQREGWRQCFEHVLNALQTWQQNSDNGDQVQCGMHGDDAGTFWDEFTAPELILELLFMSGLHGELELQTLASQLLQEKPCSDTVLHSLRNTPRSPLLSWSLVPQPDAAVLSADASCLESGHNLANALEKCRLNSGSSAKTDQSSADNLQQMAHELAATKQGKSAAVVWNRALLHQLAGQAHYQDGQTTSALYNASEALRLGSTLFSSLSPDRAAAVTDLAQPSALPSSSSHQTSPSGPPQQPSHRSPQAQDTVQDFTTDSDTKQAEDSTLNIEPSPKEAAVAQGGVRGEVGVCGVGYWQVTWLYLTSLLKLGEVYEVAGSREDALHAFREGQELAKRCGAACLSDVFSVHIAEVLLKCQAWLPYQQELDHVSRQVTTGKAQISDLLNTWMAASVSQLQGLQAQHDHCHEAACAHFESAVTQLVGSLEGVQDPGTCWLLQGLLRKARLAQAESCLYMGDNTAAADLTQAAMSDVSSGLPCPKKKRGSRNCRESRSSSSSPPVTSLHHPFEHARALRMQAKLRAACSSPIASDCISLAGCDASLAQRQHSNAEASTSAPKPPQGLGRSSSRVAKSGRGGRGTVTSSSTRAKTATNHVKDEWSQAKQYAEQGGGEDLLQQTQLLLQAYQLSQGAPLLAREVARDLSRCCSKLGLVHAGVLFEHASLGASVSLQYRGILHSKLLALERRHLCGSATPEAEQASAAITRAVAALEAGLFCGTPSQSDAGVANTKEALQEIENRASAGLSTLTSYLPPNVTTISLSIACNTPTSTSPASNQASRWHLTISRYQGAEPPILITIPVPSHSFHDPSDTGAEEEPPMVLNHQARASALEEFDSIMTDSASSMKADAPLVTSADKTAWWRKRLALDQRMAALLQHLDEDWLGPWKVLLYGTPLDSTLAVTLQEAADEVMSELSKQSSKEPAESCTEQAQPTLKALMAALIWGAASLTGRQLQVAARELLRLAGTSSDDKAIDQLSQHIRSRYDDACGASMSQAGSTADHSMQASTALRETTNVAPIANRGSSRVTGKATAPVTDVTKPKTKGKTVNRALQTTGKQASRPSRFATMQSAATAAPAHRPPPVTDLTTPTPAAPSDYPQDPALVSQLQARFDALALEEEQGQKNPVQSRQNSGDDGGWVGRVLDRHSSLLVLDGELQTLPWESLPSLEHLRLYRAPALACAAAVAARQPSAPEGSSADGPREAASVNMAHTVYMVNPAGDLSTTQATFEETFRQQRTWQGTAGEPMAPGPLATALQGHDMFLYFGHGSGDQYLSARALRRMPRCASALLMGCSSGSLAKAGQYEPSGPVLAYLMAGCPVAIANLWDVTDRDIDRFSQEVLSKWIELVPEEGSSRQHDVVQFACVSASVAMSRKACRLAALIGAAPVCYGIPVAISAAHCHGNHQ